MQLECALQVCGLVLVHDIVLGELVQHGGYLGKQGFGGTKTDQKWPTWDEDALVKSEIEIAVQVCGKVRGRVMIPADMTKERAETELQQLPEIQKILAGKTVTKVIFVPGRLVNFIAK